MATPSGASVKKPRCFIIMPISMPESAEPLYGGNKLHFRDVLDYLFCPALAKIGYEPIPPIAKGSDIIHAEIIKQLDQSELVLCDMSTLNPNVFFEFGIRTALNKPVALVRDDVTKRIPFDTSIINHHEYASALGLRNTPNEVDRLAAHLQAVIAGGSRVNSLWHYFGLSQVARLDQHGNAKDAQEELVRVEIAAMREQLSTLASKLDPSAPTLVNNLPPRDETDPLLAMIKLKFAEEHPILGIALAACRSLLRSKAGKCCFVFDENDRTRAQLLNTNKSREALATVIRDLSHTVSSVRIGIAKQNGMILELPPPA